jgi:hypothetical protein
MPTKLPLKDRSTTFLRCIPAVLLLCNAFLGYYLFQLFFFFGSSPVVVVVVVGVKTGKVGVKGFRQETED